MICEKCKAEVLPTAKFCPKCGAKVEAKVVDQSAQTKKCPQCGADNPVAAKFCKVDGFNFQQAEEKKPEKPAESAGEAAQPSVAPIRAEEVVAAAVSETKQAEVSPINAEKTAQSQVVQQGGGKTSKGPLVAVILLVLLVIAGSAGYLYYTGFMGKTPAKLGEQINNELKEKGLNLYCEVDKNWTATLKGSVKNAADKETARNIVKAHKEVKDVKDELQPQISPSDLKLAIDNALTGVGLMDIRADVDENLVATLHGTALSESDKSDAVKTAKAVDKVRDVKDNIQLQAAPLPAETASQPPLPASQPKQKRKDMASQPARPLQEPRQKRKDTATPYSGPTGLYGDEGQQQRPGSAGTEPFELEVKINRALQNAGFSRVRARVGQRVNVILHGRVANEARRAKAMAIAESFNGVRNVYDRMVVD